ncbi:GntR family transcriptional regulator [Allonocardiopsis opalescens]|uniref:GntR family transcriptional regulator n=1 Tax=Allonocardiopsis opalescens TaxID=1144618 RepID=A0A2T0QD89_9ACTN|nr:GntR family transcriptional regulator [Allonocardiopsis opalescens]PRY01875.1 GntR family transcriptional regulator [Allonocardiopsis opalescens]
MAYSSRFRKIAGDLRDRIADGTLAPGSRLPTEQELQRTYDTSRSTVRLAVAELVNEGLVVSRPGRGTYVKERLAFTYHQSRERLRLDGPPIDAFALAVAEQGRRAEQQPEVGLEITGPMVAARLRIATDATVVVRRMLRKIDDQPVSIVFSYYPQDIAQGTELLSPKGIERGAIRVLAEHGHEQVGYVDELAARMPTPDESRELELSPGVPVVECYRTAYSATRPIRVTWTVFAGDLARFQYEVNDVSAYFAGLDGDSER